MSKIDGRNIWKIACVYTTVIIGAGFASGQELLQFFADYGNIGIVGLIISGTIFSVIGWAVLDICRIKKFSGYRELISYICNKKFGLIIEIASAGFMYILYSTMLAGAGASFKQTYNLNFTSGVIITAVLIFIVLLFDLDGIVSINVKLAPILTIGGLSIGALTFYEKTITVFAYSEISHWLLSAIIYASYNIISAVSILATLGSLTEKASTAKWGGLIGGGMMTLLGLGMVYPLFIHYNQIKIMEIPLLYIAKNFGSAFQWFYLLILLCAIFTTAISNGFALSQWISDRFKLPSLLVKILLFLFGCLTAHFGFSVFVGLFYPVFSLLGLVEIILILIAWQKSRKQKLDQLGN